MRTVRAIAISTTIASTTPTTMVATVPMLKSSIPRDSGRGSAADRDRRDALVGERRLRGSEAGERHPVGRARDVVEPDLVADPELELRVDATPAFHGDPHQVADTLSVEHLERVPLEDAVLQVVREELPLRVVAREAERRLREIVRPERAEVGVLGDLVGAHARARELDHRPDAVLDLRLLGGHAVGQLPQAAELLGEPDERVHDLDEGRVTGPVGDRAGGAYDRPHLHLVDLGPLETEAAAAGAE